MATVPFEHDKVGHLTFDMQLDGKTVRVGLSSYSGHVAMTLEAARKIFGLDVNSPGMSVVSSDGKGNPQVYKYAFKSLSTDNIVIANPQIDIYADVPSCDGKLHVSYNPDRQSRCYGIGDLSLGMAELRNLHIYLAFKEQKMYVTSADAH